MKDANPGTPERVRYAPGETATAALLAAGALIERARAPRGAWIAAVPVVGVNTVAFIGQLKYWGTYLADPFQQVLVAAVLESIAIYWAWQAHRARMANDSAFRPQLAAYLFAAGVGALNYSHYMKPGWQPTVAAVTFGGMSVISPWLWASYSRRKNRDELKASGDIEDHAVRLGATRWTWHAFRCLIVMWKATWPGVTKPAEAIALYVPRRKRKRGTSGGPAHARNDSYSSDGGPAGNRGTVAVPAESTPADKAPPPARPHREPRRAESQREARVSTRPGLAAASSPDDEAKREARREAGRRGAAIRWGKQPDAVLAGQVSGNGVSHGDSH
jgi:hypothetical protein